MKKDIVTVFMKNTNFDSMVVVYFVFFSDILIKLTKFSLFTQ